MKKKKLRFEWLFILPSLIGVSIFYLIPFFNVLYRSFLSELSNKFVGFNNYILVLNNKAFKIAFNNTIKFISIYIPILLLFSLFVTLLIDYVKERQKLYLMALKRHNACLMTLKCHNAYKKIFLLPMAIPITSLVLIWKIIFHENGLINNILSYFNIAGTDYFNSSLAMLVLGLTYIWRNFGYNMLLWQTGMSGIESNMYEAAALDGAGYVKSFFYITLPQLKEMGFVIAIISILNSFKVFREAYLIAGDYPNQSIYMFQHLFNNWFVNLEMGKLAAGAALIAVFVLILIGFLKRLLTQTT